MLLFEPKKVGSQTQIPGSRQWRLRIAAIVALGIASSIGCNPGTLMYFILPHDGNVPPAYSLTEKKREVKVVLLVSHKNSRTQTTSLWDADRQLAEELKKQLEQRFRENGQKAIVVPHYNVQQFKLENANNWKMKSDHEIGKHFKADFVLNFEINKLSLYEHRSRSLFRGRANIYVRATNVSKPADESLEFTKRYTTEYPKNGPKSADFDTSEGDFRARFFRRMARELTRYFARHPRDEKRNDLDSTH